jgi:hypothetical protein
MALGATPDHGGCCLVSGDVFVWFAPVLLAPCAGVGRVDRKQPDTGRSGLCGEPVTEHRGRDAGYRFAEPFATLAAAHRLAPDGAGISEIEVLDRDRVAARTPMMWRYCASRDSRYCSSLAPMIAFAHRALD